MSKFRTDIQGLRAFAVLAVVLFHFNPSWLTGGFIGVDIFFVISGYLMTSIVINDISAKKFSLQQFYIARVVRIVPALLLLCIVVTAFGVFTLNLVDASKITKHAASSISFVSNFTYWSESGYFDAASKDNWLLHTWSLSVEWQFYILYPIVILLCSKVFSVITIARLTVLAIIVGYGVSVWASNAMPSAAYFLLPTRAWELLLGGIAFYYPLPKSVTQKTRTILEILGLSIILGSALLITENIAWPGSIALFPVFAAFLVLLANKQNSILTGNALAQIIGKWSYSIYLWHWPVVVFIGYFDLPRWTWSIGVSISIFVGWLSYQYCENKFAKKPIASKVYGPVHVLACFSVVFSMMLGVAYFKGSILQKNIDTVEPYLAGQNYFAGDSLLDATASKTYFLNGASKGDFDYIAIGDSNLAHYVYGIESENTKKVILSWEGYCLSLPNYITKPSANYMNKAWEAYCKNNYKNIDKYPTKPIILANLWTAREMLCVMEPCEESTSKSNFFNLLEHQLANLIEISGSNRPIVIIGQVPAPKNSVYRCMKGFDSDSCARLSNENENERVGVNAFLKKFSANHESVLFINPFEAVCNERYECKTIIDDKSLFHDEGHLSAFGSKYFWKFISVKIDQFMVLH